MQGDGEVEALALMRCSQFALTQVQCLNGEAAEYGFFQMVGDVRPLK